MKWLTCLMVLCAGCIATPSSRVDEQASGVTQYVAISDFQGTDQGAWYDETARLNAAFTASGEYPGITPLTFTCSVTSKRGDVHQCGWTFASVTFAVAPDRLSMPSSRPTYVCTFTAATTAAKLSAFLAGTADPLHDALPGGAALDASLPDCFAHPIGALPLDPGTSSSPEYVAASDYYTSPTYRARWQGAVDALAGNFADRCGDTFCGSDYTDLQSLQLECMVTKSTGNLKACEWAFGGSYWQVAKNGELQATAKTFLCSIPLGGTIQDLIATMLADDPGVEPLDRPLPAIGGTVYDALGYCLP